MSRSNNSRKGKKHHRQGGRHHGCSERGCDYCLSNFTIATRRQTPAKDHE